MTKTKYIIRELSDDGLLKPVERYLKYSGWTHAVDRIYDSQEQAAEAIEESGYGGNFILLTVVIK